MANLLDALRAAGSEELQKCVICEVEGEVDTRWQHFLCLPPPFGVMRCRRCAIRWLSPRPNPSGLARLYSNEHYFEPDDLPEYRLFATQRREHFVRRVREMLAIKAHCSILDFGAATGEFVAIAKDEGARATGVEFSADARAQAKERLGLDLTSASEAHMLAGPFDFIHMNHVLEHMPDPLSHLRWCARKLSAGGMLVIEVPNQFDNDTDRLRRLAGTGGRQQKFDAFSVHHTFFFSPQGLADMVERAGLAVVSLRTPIAPLFGGTSLKRRLMGAALHLSNRLHHGGDAIELWSTPDEQTRTSLT